MLTARSRSACLLAAGPLGLALLATTMLLGCAPPIPERARYRGGDAPVSRAADAGMVLIPAGSFIVGSTPAEREQAYRDYRASAGHDGARRAKWFDREEEPHRASLPAFRIDRTLVTNAAYAEFVRDTGAALPAIDEARWREQGFIQDFHEHVTRHIWRRPAPPEGRADHPVVLVTWDEAAAYCTWRGQVAGAPRRLPTAHEYEKAARGPDGAVYPWGPDFDPARLNSHVAGPDDTTPVEQFPNGVSPYGMYDAAGNTFQWTETPWPRGGRMTVKGSAWDDYAGLGRGAAQHGRRPWVRHVLIGFRCAGPE
ncbi:formylglycine-generating enzyme family protein [Haliangium sp.]|uniref:formylglycine-generating enzyme family protein n=1 Tax=Haliangium sp. TaxID=2663208 RepID=UPI003D0FF779